MHGIELSQLAIAPAVSDADLEGMIHVRALVTPEARPTVENLRINLESNPELAYLVGRLGDETVACGYRPRARRRAFPRDRRAPSGTRG